MEQRQVNLIWVLGGIYLVYIACEMLFNLVTGTAEMPAVSGVGGVIFLAVGAWMLHREWKIYRRIQAQKSEESQPEDEETEDGEAL